MQLSNVQTLRLKHGRVVIDVLNEDCYWQIRCAAVSTITRQPEPGTNKYLSHYLQYFIVQHTEEVGDLMYVVIKGDEHKVSSFLQGVSWIGGQICHTQFQQSRNKIFSNRIVLGLFQDIPEEGCGFALVRQMFQRFCKNNGHVASVNFTEGEVSISSRLKHEIHYLHCSLLSTAQT